MLRLILCGAASALLAAGYSTRASAQLTCSTSGTSTALVVGACLTIDGAIFDVSALNGPGLSGGSTPSGVTYNLSDAVLEQDGSNFGVTVTNLSGQPLVTVNGGATLDFDVTFLVANATPGATPLSTIDKIGLGLSGSAPAIRGGSGISTDETISVSGIGQVASVDGGIGPNSTSFANSPMFSNPNGSELTLYKDINFNTDTSDANTSDQFQLASIRQDLIPVPEPGTVGVFSVALAALISVRRRKR